MDKSSFDVFCPECNMLVEAKVIAKGYGGFRSEAFHATEEEVDADYHGEHYYVCLCRRCNQPFLLRQSLYSFPSSEFGTFTKETTLYPNESKLPLESLPDAVKTAYDQALRSFRASLFEPCVLMCRKCLEAVCKTFGVKGRDLKEGLTALSEANHIDARLLNWAHAIRLIGNVAAHEIEVPVSKEDARDVLEFTEAILIYVFSLTKRFESFEARRLRPNGNKE